MSEYIFLSSQAFISKVYPQNQPFDFISTVLNPLQLDSESWEVALTEIDWKQKDIKLNEDLYVMTDIVAGEIQVGTLFPQILRIITEPTIFTQPYYVKLSRGYIDSIRIYIRLGDNSEPDYAISSLRCTLHFRKIIH